MFKFIFDEYGNYSGQDRETMNDELEIYLNEFPTDLTKTVESHETRIRKDSQGNDLYVIRETGIFEEIDGRVTTTEETDDPVYDQEFERHPILDSKGEHKFIVDTVRQLTTDKTSIIAKDSEGVPMKNSKGEQLYYQDVEVSEREYLYETERINVQRVDGKGAPLFWKDGKITVYNPDGVSESYVTRFDEEWNDTLDIATIVTPFIVTKSFESDPFQFTYEDLRVYKRDKLLDKTFALESFLLEDYNEAFFERYDGVDIAKNSIRINPGGFIETKPFTFSKSGNYFKLFPEVSNKGLVFTAVTMEDGLRVERPFSTLNELITSVPIQTLSIYTENKGDNSVIVDSIGIIS